jgi:hypothetical protein
VDIINFQAEEYRARLEECAATRWSPGQNTRTGIQNKKKGIKSTLILKKVDEVCITAFIDG